MARADYDHRGNSRRLAVVLIGAVLWVRARKLSHARHFHTEAEKHDHDCEKTHGARSAGELLTLGLAAGIVPCPAGVAVLLAAIVTGQILNGLLFTLAFSAGVGVLIFAVGVVMWRTASLLERFFAKSEPLVLRLPQITSIIIFAVGLLASGHGIWEVIKSH